MARAHLSPLNSYLPANVTQPWSAAIPGESITTQPTLVSAPVREYQDAVPTCISDAQHHRRDAAGNLELKALAESIKSLANRLKAVENETVTFALWNVPIPSSRNLADKERSHWKSHLHADQNGSLSLTGPTIGSSKENNVVVPASPDTASVHEANKANNPSQHEAQAALGLTSMTADFATDTHVDTRNRDTECRYTPYATVRKDGRVDGYALQGHLSNTGSKPTATPSLSHIRDSGVATALLAPTPLPSPCRVPRHAGAISYSVLAVF
ncbi:hypothetical protein HPB51_015533 [Rhipicephalus microplus]|uniref:Uncharacterized protein n=1 Tax=Rhipicephalus microplus TaxID=6941 RepID=A0A9J6DNJ9_RHIMP|nr:hypothetical protein HPB51_015533 [Rhipicephalus microplus]